ncbi:MAG: MXAN_6577-like cysteine-rich protein [Polyangiaceae bacterium]
MHTKSKPSLSARLRAFAALSGFFVIASCSAFGSDLSGFTEGGGSEACDSGLTRCGDLCVDVQSNPAHCGACGTTCDSGLVCGNGSCSDSCPGGLDNCDGACVDLQNNAQNCGSCGTPCGAGQSCSGGQCSSSCSSGEESCGGSCVNTQTDTQHCGGCGKACASGQECQGGSCVASCSALETQCGSVCVDTQTNSQHCGKCDNPCPAGQICTDGACTIFCPGGQVECNGLCFDLQSDVNNCGACDKKCAAGEVCTSGNCDLNCSSGQTKCDNSCVDTQTNPNHCGTCGKVCGATEECSAGNCVIACKTLLKQPIPDDHGNEWDGLLRTPGDLPTAVAACEAIGGRLPTATELYNASFTQSASVGQPSSTDQLWTLVPYNATQQVRGRLSDGALTNVAKTTSLAYRCICPAPLPDSFSGNNCQGPSGQACFNLEAEGKRINLDIKDRAPLPTGAAMWECGFNRGRLARSFTLFEAMLQGLPNGSNTYLHAADAVRYDLNAILRWTAVASAPTFSVNGNWSGTTNYRPFRCAGVNYASGRHPATIAGEYLPTWSNLKGETTDSAAKVAWADAHDACFAKGGHLPSSFELAELIAQGLPGGTNQWMWGSDVPGYNGTNFLSHLIRWTGALTEMGFSNPTDITWGYKTTTNFHRCVYYPVDTAYTGPQTADCSGGCFAVTPTGTSGAKMWFDNFDRPSASLEAAVDDCRKLGGHLPSERDYMEAIRNGLPNGQGAIASLWAGDLAVGSSGTNQLRDSIVKWSGVDTAYTGLYSAYTTWSNVTVAGRPYRCMWTNELR